MDTHTYDAIVVANNIFQYIQSEAEKNYRESLMSKEKERPLTPMEQPVTYKNLSQLMVLLQAKHLKDTGRPLFKEPIQMEKNGEFSVKSKKLDQKYGHFGLGNLVSLPVYVTGYMETNEKDWLHKHVKALVMQNEHKKEEVQKKMREDLVYKYNRPSMDAVRLSDLEAFGKQIHLNSEKERAVPSPEIANAPTKKVDNVNHPGHYAGQGKVECIDFIATVVNQYPGILAGDLQNVNKYTWRSHGKNGKEDISKAQWYFNHAEKTFLSLDKNSQQALINTTDTMKKVMLSPGKTLKNMEDTQKLGIEEVTKNMPQEEKELYHKIIHGVTHFYEEKARSETKEALQQWIQQYDRFQSQENKQEVILHTGKPMTEEKGHGR